MNCTHPIVPTYFIIKGISDVPELLLLVFLLVLLIYLLTLSGNMTILLLVCLDPQLHTPMYFFLGNLATLDMLSTTVTLHKILINFLSGSNSVSFIGCMAQMFIFSSLTNNELLLLTAMSYDRYVAICNPLLYNMVMNRRTCVLLATICWVLGFLEIMPILWIMTGFTCYRSNVVHHFFCDIVPLMKLSCGDTSRLELYLLLDGVVFGGLIPFLLTFISYIFIIHAIIKMSTSSGRRKAFYTCSSHLAVVGLLYVTLVCQYLRPTSTDSLAANKPLSLFNTAAVPMLNPLIYSLKNKDVKSALRRRIQHYKMIM